VHGLRLLLLLRRGGCLCWRCGGDLRDLLVIVLLVRGRRLRGRTLAAALLALKRRGMACPPLHIAMWG